MVLTPWQDITMDFTKMPESLGYNYILVVVDQFSKEVVFVPCTKEETCHNRDARSTLYHSVRSHPCVYRPFHCMYLRSPIISILLVLPPISECFVWSVFPYNYLICFRLRSRLLSVPVLLYLLIRYTSGNWPQTSPGLLIALRELCWSLACLTPWASPCTFYSSI